MCVNAGLEAVLSNSLFNSELWIKGLAKKTEQNQFLTTYQNVILIDDLLSTLIKPLVTTYKLFIKYASVGNDKNNQLTKNEKQKTKYVKKK